LKAEKDQEKETPRRNPRNKRLLAVRDTQDGRDDERPAVAQDMLAEI
jgi:hypothetical protein